jgi:hypothetical protein
MLLNRQCNDNERKVNCNNVFKFSVSSILKTKFHSEIKSIFMNKIILKIVLIAFVAIAFTSCASRKSCPTNNPRYFTS